jgi:hypothetical protein
MSSRPTRKKLPTTKLSADNAGDLELSSHRTVIASLTTAAPSATPQGPQQGVVVDPSSASEPQPNLVTGSTADVAPAAPSANAKRPRNPFILDSSDESAAADVAAAQPAPRPPPHRLGPPSRAPAKRPRNPFVLHSDTDTDPEVVVDEDPVPRPKAKKAKKAKKASDQDTSQLHADSSIITIDDIEDPRDERLNKTDPTADIREFFVAVPPGPGENKPRMKCNLCACISSFSSCGFLTRLLHI